MTKIVPTISIRKSDNDTQIGVLYDYFNDSIERYLEGKVSVFTFSVLDENNYRELLEKGNSLSFTYDDEDYHLTIVKKEEDEDVITITAWSLVLELNNETKSAYEGKNLTFAQYLDAFDGENILTLNINEVSDKKISNKWESQQSMLERLFSLATVFSAELEFVSILADDGSLRELQVNVYKSHDEKNQGLGKDRSSEVFYFGEDITTVKKTSDIMNLYTAIRPVGKDGLTLKNYTMADIKDENGDIVYTCKNGMIYAPQAREQFPSNLINKADKWTVYDWETDYTTQASLAGNALSKLKALSVPNVTWTIEGYIDAKIGDTISVHDNGYTPTLLLEARINTQKICMTDPSKNETTFSNVIEQESEISEELISRMNALIAENEKYELEISTKNGVILKNGKGSTTLNAHVRKGGQDLTDLLNLKWYKDLQSYASGKSIVVNASDITVSLFRVEAYLEEELKASGEVTISNIDETKIIRQDNPPLADANTIWIDSSNQINELDVAKIYNQLKDDWVRVTPTLPSEVGAFGYESGVALTDQVNNISIDTSQLQADAEEMRANAEQIRLDMQKAREELDADIVALQEDVDTKNSDITQLINSNKIDTDKALATANTAISDANKKIAATDENVTNINTSITNINNELTTKVEKEEVDVIKQTVSNQATEIKQNTDSIALKADSETVDALNQTVSNQSTLIEQNAGAIALKASSVDVDAVKKTVTAHDSKLTQTAKDITSLVTKTDDTNTALSEVKQTADGLTTKIGTIEENADSTSTKLSTLEQNVSGFKTTVSDTYETKTNVDTKTNKAKTDAIASAKTETASQVKQMSDSITQIVSEKYADKNYVASQIEQKAGSITSTIAQNYATKLYTDQGIQNVLSSAKADTDEKLSKMGNFKRYSWSKDGTDRFTKYNIGENILDDSLLAKGYVQSSTGADGTSSIHTRLSSAISLFGIKTVKISLGTYPSDSQFKIYGLDSNNTLIETVTVSDGQVYTFKSNSEKLKIEANKQDLSLISKYNIKLNFIPSSDIDYDNAIPRYIGRSLKDSNDPTDYIWEVNPERKPETAWANSSDGTTDFTQKYPVNLLSMRYPQTIDNIPKQDERYKVGKIGTTVSGWNNQYITDRIDLADKVTVTCGIYIYPVEADGTSVIRFYTGATSYVETSFKDLPVNQWTLITKSIASNSVAMQSVTYGKNITYHTMPFAFVGNAPDFYVPNEKDDKLGSIMRYKGIGKVDSKSPSDYTWQLNPAWLEVNTETIVTDKYSQSVQDLDGFRNTVGATYQTKDAMTGYYNKAETNSQINQKAGEITSTVSTTYTTKSDFNTGINNAATDATTKANNALASAKTDATNKANDAKIQAVSLAKTETTSQVKQLSDSITSTISKMTGAGNLVAKSTFEDGQKGNWTSGSLDQTIYKPDDTPSKMSRLLQWSTRDNYEDQWFDIKAGETYYFEAYLSAYSANYPVRFGMHMKTADGTDEWQLRASVGKGTSLQLVSGEYTVPSISKMIKARPFLQIDGFSDFGIARAVGMRIENVTVAYSKIQQTAESITSTVSQKVGKSEVISTINQSPEAVTINASKINLQGALTISQFSTSDRDKINNGISTANTANSTANIAQSRADSAYNLANTANGTANTVNSQINSWKKPGTTMIDGGNIYADSLSVITGNMGNLNINGEMSGYSGSNRVSLFNRDSLNFYEEDGSNKFTLNAKGITNINSGYGTRTIGFFDEGIVVKAGANNTGNNKNSGIVAEGSSTYLWLTSNDGKDSNGFQILNTPTGSHINADKDIYLRPKGQLSIYTNRGIQLNGNYVLGSGNLIESTGGDASGSYKIDRMKVLENKGNRYIEVMFNNQVYGITIFASDARLKKNIQDTDKKALEKILKIPIKQFDWINGGDHREYGFIAQEIEKILPDAVFSVNQNDGTDVKQIAVDGMLPPMVEAIQELSRQNKELQAKVDTLYSFIESIDINKITK